MSVVVGDLDTLMSHSICDCCCRKAEINQVTDMTVANIVDSDPLDASFLRPSVHLSMEITLCLGNEMVRLLFSVFGVVIKSLPFRC